MSRSWIKAFRPAPKRTAGLAIGRSQVCAVVLSPNPDRPQLHSVQVRALPTGLFDSLPATEAEDELTRALSTVTQEIRDLYAPIHVALPDTVLRCSVFELDELPSKPQARQSLLNWRCAQFWARNEEFLECRGTDLGSDGPTRLLFAQAGENMWLACVRRALARSKVMAWSMNAALAYRFNAFHERLAQSPGILVALSPDSWSLLVWDGAGRPRHVLTRLRDTQTSFGDAASIADEAERAILAYAQAHDGRDLGRLHLTGSPNEIAALMRAFDGRVREAPVKLGLEESLGGRLTSDVDWSDGWACTALAAALNS